MAYAQVEEASPVEQTITVHLKQGEPIAGTLLTFTPAQVRVRVQIGVGSAERSIAVEDIDYILFGEEPGEEQLLTSPEFEDAESLAELYGRKRRFLKVPRNNAGEVGLAYVRVVLDEARRKKHVDALPDDLPDDGSDPLSLKDPSKLPLVVYERALRMAREIETNDWNEARKVESRLLRLKLMLTQGEREPVMEEARELAESTRNLGVHLEARLMVAEVSFEELQWLVEDNPRWIEDDVVRPERDRMFNQTLDAFLYPSLFHPTREEPSARGLMAAARVYEHAGELPLAIACAVDVLALYPEAAPAGEARELLQRHPPDEVTEELVTQAEQAADAALGDDSDEQLIDDPLMRSMQEQLQRRRVTPMETDDDEAPTGDPPPSSNRFEDEDF